MTEIVRFENVTKRYHKKDRFLSRGDLLVAVKDVSFSVPRGQTVGLVGRNGSGKTTLMRLVAQITTPTSGKITVRGRTMPVLSLEGCLHTNLTGIENIRFLMAVHLLGGAEKRRLFPLIAEFSGLGEFLDMPVKKYSSGMRSRLSFSVAAHLPCDLLLVDEVLSVGDKEFQQRARARIARFKEEGGTVFFASHSLDEMRSVAERALWLDAGALVADGAPDDVLRRYESSPAHGAR